MAYLDPLIGGILIGLGSLLAMAASGKIPGISGILARTLRWNRGDTAWRIVFLVGLIGGAAISFALNLGWDEFTVPAGRSLWVYGIAGLLVGLGTRVGGGCTSGHGVCGMGAGAKDGMPLHHDLHGHCCDHRLSLEPLHEGRIRRMKMFTILLAGALFGSGLVVSGMTDPARVIGFLDFFGNWDPALAFVMGGAVAVFGLGLLILRKGKIRLFSTDLPDTSASPISKRFAIGSAVFGIGWGLSGFCPGPALANLSEMHTEVLVFVPLMLLGMFVAQRVFGLDR